MRRVFTSQRLETVEGVAKLLQDAGIEVHIRNARSYHSRRGGQFSYATPSAPGRQPAVWVRKPEDQPRARTLLREAGLLATTRTGLSSQPAGIDEFQSRFDGNRTSIRWTWYLRAILLAVATAAAVLIWLRHPRPSPTPATDAPTVDTASEIRVRISPLPPDSP
ncbi:MAG: DUF2007 domain-containing protein [Xanthomonadaceae bacterium]|jgi:hypothetical protein|nr:DUF2007 domain-containing protein [Xanthomonadaceae bacterium]